jgi:predicted RNase H-like HicB family nuclease
VTVRYTVVLEKGETSWGAHVPDLPGCVAVGESRDEALSLIRESVGLHLAELREQGVQVPAPVSESEVIEVGGA